MNEFRAGMFRNRNDSDPVSYFTNAEFGIQSPLDAKVPDLTQLDIRGDRDVGGRVRFGTPSDGTRIYDLQTTEGLFQIEHDQSRPELNKGLSDFHRKHRVILSWAWDLPFRGNPFVEGWQIAGIGTFQSGRPFTITDGEFSAVLVSTTNPRPNLAPGATHEDQTTSGSVNSRLDKYLNPAAFVSSGTAFGDLGRNTVIGPDQRRVDVSVSKITSITNGRSLEFRLEAYNVTNTPTFRNPARGISAANFGQITRTRGGPRVIQLGLKVRF